MSLSDILIVEDDPLGGRFMCDAIKRWGFDATLVNNGTDALDIFEKEQFGLVFTDLKMDGMGGMEVLRHIKKQRPETEVVLMTAYGTIDNAVEAMREGAFDYITKPISPGELQLVIDRVNERRRLVAENQFLRSELEKRKGVESVLGKSRAIGKIRDTIQMAASTDAVFLIEGETGTGKEIIADAIQSASQRRHRAYVKINCAALPHTLLESELFGHEKGAFTGAVARVKGRFELADGGTLLLDEIADLDTAMQVKLLRVLQFNEFERIGSGKTIKVDVRVIATTNRNLLEEVKKGTFRKDLYFRLNTLYVKIPPLRERPEDIPVLVEHFIGKYTDKTELKRLSGEAVQLLLEHSWPGNVRELENSIETAIVMSNGCDVITPEHFPYVKDHEQLMEEDNDGGGVMSLRDAERDLIVRTLQRCRGNRSKSAQILGITPKTLRNKLKEYGLFEQPVDG